MGRLQKEPLATGDGLRGRRRTEQQYDHEPLDDLPFLESVRRVARVAQGMLGSLLTTPGSPVEVVRLRSEPPCAREPEFVVEALENVDRSSRDVVKPGE